MAKVTKIEIRSWGELKGSLSIEPEELNYISIDLIVEKNSERIRLDFNGGTVQIIDADGVVSITHPFNFEF